MKSVENIRRELFESQLVKEHQGALMLLTKKPSGNYYNGYVQSRWDGFNAALDSVVIEVPPYHELHEMTSGDLYDAVLVSIESTNLGLKVK